MEVLKNLYVGGDTEYARIKDKPEWRTLRCCKYGTGGHQETLSYHTLSAPKGPDYLSVVRGHRMALNFIDAHDPNFIPLKMIETGLEYIAREMKAGHKVLVACNSGQSRGPTTAMLYMRAIGELPGSFAGSERVYRTLYPNYDPGIGVRTFARQQWSHFDDLFKGNK